MSSPGGGLVLKKYQRPQDLKKSMQPDNGDDWASVDEIKEIV